MSSTNNPFDKLQEFIIEAERTIGSDGAIELPPIKRIVGRDELINKIVEEWNYARNNQVLIVGKTGTGKTSAIVNCAHNLLNKNPYEIVLFLDLRSATIELSNLDDLVRYIGNFLVIGQHNFQQETEDRIAAIKRKLSEKKALFVIDNLDRSISRLVHEFILQLPFKTDLVISSLNKLSDIPAIYEIGNLEESTASPFIESQCTNLNLRPINKASIFKMSRGNPKIISWILNLLSEGKSLDKIDLEIKAGKTELQQYYFDSIWNTLSDELRDLLLLFSIANRLDLNLIMDIAVVSRFTKLKETEIADLFHELTTKGILEHIGDTCFEINDLADGYVNSKITKEKNKKVRAAWYGSILHEIDQLILTSNWQDVFEFIDDYFNTIFKGVTDADLTDNIRFKILNAFSYYLYSRGMWLELESVSEFNFKKVTRPLPILENYINCIPGWYVRSKIKLGRREEALKIFESVDNKIDESSSWAAKAFMRVLRTGYYTKKEQLDLPTISDLEGISMQLLAAGNILWGLQSLMKVANLWNRFEKVGESERCNKKIVEFVDQHAANTAWLREIKSLSNGNLGVLYNKQSKFPEAEESLLSIVKDLAQTIEKGTAFAELAYSFYKRGNWSVAFNYTQNFLAIKTQLEIDITIMESATDWDNTEAVIFFEKYKKWGPLYRLKLW
jgi:MinD-like ATPase involved in chromosome partitioning or flagellar assembly